MSNHATAKEYRRNLLWFGQGSGCPFVRLFLTALLCYMLMLTMCLTWPGTETALAQAAPEDPVVAMEGLKVEILWGDNSLVRIGRDIPITVRLNSTGAEMTGTARAAVPMGGGEYYVLEETVSVAAGETRQVVLSVPVNYDTSTIQVEFEGMDGVIYGSRQVHLRSDYGDQELYVAVISSDVGQLAAFDRVVLNEYRGTTTRLFDFKEDSLPTDVNVLKLYDIFLWDDGDLEQISDEQREALDSWVYGGGILILGADGEQEKAAEDKEIRREGWGRGLYVYCGFSLRDISTEYPGEEGVRKFLYEAVGESRMTAIEENMEDSYGDYWSASSMTSGVDAGRIPQVWQYAVVLLIYLVLLGPVLYSVLKKKKRRNQLRISMIGLALAFTVVIYAMGSRTRCYRPFLNYASVQEIRSGVMVETVYANVFSPSNASYSMEFGVGYDVVPLINYSYDTQETEQDEVCRLQISKEADGTQVWVRENIPFTANILRLSGTESSPYGDGFKGDITLFEDGWEGTLYNGTGQDFEQVCVLAGGRVVMVGDLAAGAQADLAQFATQLIYGPGQDALLEAMAGASAYDTPVESQEASQATWRYRVLYSYFQNQMLDESGTALVMGFPAEEKGDYLVGTSVEVQGATLVTEAIPLNDSKGGYCYFPMDQERIDVLQGSYDYTRNSTNEALCVLRYDFGDLMAEELLLVWPEQPQGEYQKTLDGPLAFYNWETGQYDLMGKEARYDRQALAPYLDEDNGLTIRYSVEEMGDTYYEVFLPDLSVVGREMR